MLKLCEEFGIPDPSEQQLKTYTRNLAIFADDAGKFSKNIYDSIVEMFNMIGGGQTKLTQILCENYKINSLANLIAGNGIIFEDQVQETLKKLHTEYDFIVGTILPDDEADSAVSDEEIENFYDKNPKRYVQLPMHYVSMIRFDEEHFVHKVQRPSEEELKKFFDENRDKFTAGVEFEEVKQTAMETYIHTHASRLACTAAEDFVATLYKEEIPLNSDKFFALLDKFDVTKEEVAAYSKKKLPTVNGVNAAYLLAACDLTEDRYFSDAYPTTFGSVVLILEKTKQEHYLTLDEARSAIRNDIIKAYKAEHFTEKVNKICDEVALAMENETSPARVFNAHKVGFDTFVGYSIANAEEKKLDPLYINALLALKSDEKTKKIVVNAEDVKLLAITKKNLPLEMLESRPALLAIRQQLEQADRASLLAEFFIEQCTVKGGARR